jgi:hypothetical protein
MEENVISKRVFVIVNLVGELMIAQFERVPDLKVLINLNAPGMVLVISELENVFVMICLEISLIVQKKNVQIVVLGTEPVMMEFVNVIQHGN